MPHLRRIFGVLGALSGLVLSVLRLLIGGLGVYATWPPCELKTRWIATYSVLNFLWIGADLVFVALLFAGDIGPLRTVSRQIRTRLLPVPAPQAPRGGPTPYLYSSGSGIAFPY